MRFWSAQETVKRIWFSLYTPQVREESPEILKPVERQRVIKEIAELRARYDKLHMPDGVLAAYAAPPSSPKDCPFARMTRCVSADLKKAITPCQFGGNPDCSNCGCMASAGMAAIARHRLPGGLSLGAIMDASMSVGRLAAAWRGAVS